MRSADAIIALRFVDFPLYQAFAGLTAGAFGTLNTPSMTGSIINNGSQDSIMSWARRGHADLGADRLYFYGATHGGGTPAQNMSYMIRYSLATHTWVKEAINSPEAFDSSGRHGYYQFAQRQSDGHQFIRDTRTATIYSRTRDGAWGTSEVPTLPGTQFIEWNNGNALEWYPDFGAAGALVFASTSRIYTWEPGDPSWTIRGAFGGSSEIDNWIVYNRADSRIYTGIDQVMRRLDPNGTVVTRSGPPFNCSVGTTTPGTVFSSGLTGNRMFAINVSGTRPVHEYNHSTDTWSSSITNLPAAFDAVESGPTYLFFGITVPNHGVMWHVIDGNPNPSATMHLWRR